MMFMKKNIKIIFGILVTCLVLFFGWGFWQYQSYNKAVKAAGGYPLECGFSVAIPTPCIGVGPICPPGVCTSRSACVPSGEPLYYDVKGVMAGGNPACAAGILLSTAMVNTLNLKTGASLIAGGMGPTMMEGGVAASFTGTFPIAMINFYKSLAEVVNNLKSFI
jgi:hypothetical protein